MSTRLLRARPDADVVVAAAAAVTLGVGATLALGGAAAQQTALAIGGGVAAATAAVVLVVAGWVDVLPLLIVALPMPAPYSSDSFRLAPAAVVSALVVLAGVSRISLDRRRMELGALPRRATLALLVADAFSAVFAQQAGPALREVANMSLLLALLIVVTYELTRRPGRAHEVALVIGGVVGVAGCFAGLQALGVLPSAFHWGASFYRATLGFGWPNELGMFMAIGLPFCAYTCAVAPRSTPRALAIVGLAGGVLGLAATFSRGSWSAVLMGTIVLAFVGQRRFVVRVWVAAIVALVLLDVGSGGAITGRIASTRSDLVVGQRLSLMLAGTVMFRAHPIVGVGPGGFGPNLEQYGPQVAQLWDYTGSAQNLYVHMAAETGVIGLAALLAFLGATLVTLFRAARRDARSDAPGEVRRDVRDAGRQAGMDGGPTSAVLLRRTLLWSFATACCVGFFEWPFAHGVGELIVLVAAMGFAMERAGARP